MIKRIQRIRVRTRILGLIVIVYLTGCASLVITDKADWVLEAKVHYSDSQQTRIGLLRWQQLGNDFDMRLSGIGTGELARLRKTDGQFELRVRGQTYDDLTEINGLLAEQVGMTIPAENLQYWIRQQPNPSQPFDERHDYRGRIVYLIQDLWQITYDYQYGSAKRMTAEKPPYRIVLVTIDSS